MFVKNYLDRKYCIPPKILFLDKFGPKNQNNQYKLKFGIETYSNMHNFSGGVQFFCFRPEIPFLGKFGPKNYNCLINLVPRLI